MKKITVLIPCYNEEDSLPLLWNELKKLADDNRTYQWQFLFVNDGSTDNTLDIICNFRAEDERACFIDLSRNFGKEAAMLAGFDNADGDCVVIMDADLQHPVSVIPEMVMYWEQGYDDVYGKRKERGKESWLRKKLSLGFYKFLADTSDINILQNVGDFRLLDRKCIEALKALRESERYTKGLYSWIGFKKKEITFEQQDRLAGRSSMGSRNLTNLAINAITAHSTAPIKFMTVFGLFVSLAAVVYLLFIICRTMLYGDPVKGFPTLVVIILFLGGIQIMCFGIIGEYIGRIFNETKNRPVYFVKRVEK
ncbi:MAG: glycosyltransferase family 2 protein [Muribaculaceae bacterium]|nr:glycosyltransferase family 2 protein [Muribaculaceae bacterium]